MPGSCATRARPKSETQSRPSFDSSKIRRLYIAVDHTLVVCVVQGVRDISQELRDGVEPLPARSSRVGKAARLRGIISSRIRYRRFEQRIRALFTKIIENGGQRLALDQFHGVEVAALLLPRRVHRDDVGVVQLGGRLGFTVEALHSLFGEPQSGRKDFQRYPAVQGSLPGFVDDAHAAAADLVKKLEVSEAVEWHTSITAGRPAAGACRFVGHGHASF
jgi:hypothetical protein